MNAPLPIETWQRLTREGNAHFSEGAPAAALGCYLAACRIVRNCAHAWSNADDALAAHVVSDLNLSEAQSRCGQLHAAAETLCAIHCRLLHASESAALDPPGRHAARSHLRATLQALLSFQQAHGPHAAVTRCLQRLPDPDGASRPSH